MATVSQKFKKFNSLLSQERELGEQIEGMKEVIYYRMTTMHIFRCPELRPKCHDYVFALENLDTYQERIKVIRRNIMKHILREQAQLNGTKSKF